MTDETSVSSCLNLSVVHIVQYWSKWSDGKVASELLSLGHPACPKDLREAVLRGEIKHFKIMIFTRKCRDLRNREEMLIAGNSEAKTRKENSR